VLAGAFVCVCVPPGDGLTDPDGLAVREGLAVRGGLGDRDGVRPGDGVPLGTELVDAGPGFGAGSGGVGRTQM
jgi:hypothetical protein